MINESRISQHMQNNCDACLNSRFDVDCRCACHFVIWNFATMALCCANSRQPLYTHSIFFANEHSNCVLVNAKIQFMCNKIMIEITLNLLHTQNTSLNSTLLSNARFMELNVFLDFISFLFTSPVSGLCMPSAAAATTKNLRTKNRSWFCELKGLSSFCACQLFWLVHFFAKCFWNWEQREANVISRNNNQEKKNYCHASSDREIWTESLLFFFLFMPFISTMYLHIDFGFCWVVLQSWRFWKFHKYLRTRRLMICK